MTDRYVVAFDVGTSGVKAVLADLGGRPVASRYEPYGLRAAAGGVVEQDVEEIHARLGAACRSLLARPGVAPGQVAAVSVTAQMFNVVPVGAAGEPLMPMLSWLDTRAAPQAAALADPADIEARREFISSERDRVFAALTRLEGVEPHPSEGNFILMNVAASGRTNDEIIRIAHAEKILLRAMGSHRLRGTHVRVTIGLAEQNDRFLDLFGRLFAPGASLASRSA